MQKTKIEYYPNQRAANNGISRHERFGYRVVSVQTIDQGWSLLKTGCLGLIFLPLALLGKKRPVIQVTFQKVY